MQCYFHLCLYTFLSIVRKVQKRILAGAILKKKGSELLEEIIENFNCFLIKIKKLAVIYVLRTAN